MPSASRVASAVGLVVCVGCATPPDAPPSTSLTFDIPASLEHRRAAYVDEVGVALDRVLRWSEHNGLRVQRGDLLEHVIVFADSADAKRAVAKHFAVGEDQVPDGFSGTVDGKTLFVVSTEAFGKTFRRLYPTYSYSDADHAALVTHELAHRAHALVATEIGGSEDAMGPRWFFEGLAILCASQFSQEPAIEWAEAKQLIEQDREKPLSYRHYGQIIRSLSARFSVRWMIEHAAAENFVDLLSPIPSN